MSTPGPQTHIHSCVCTLHLYHRSSPLAPIASPGPVSAALRHRLYTGRCSLAVAHRPLLTDHVSHRSHRLYTGAAHGPLLTGRCSPTTSALQPPPLHRPLFTGRCSPAAAHRPRQHWRWKEEIEWQCKQLVPFSPCFGQWLHKSQSCTAPPAAQRGGHSGHSEKRNCREPLKMNDSRREREREREREERERERERERRGGGIGVGGEKGC